MLQHPIPNDWTTSIHASHTVPLGNPAVNYEPSSNGLAKLSLSQTVTTGQEQLVVQRNRRIVT